MSNVIPLRENDNEINSIEQSACDWIACLTLDALNPGREKALHLWLAQDPRHSQALFEMASLMDDISVLSRLEDLIPLVPNVSKTTLTATSIRSVGAGLAALIRRPQYGVTACCLLLMVAFLMFPLQSENYTVTASTHVGERKTIELADGSLVTLNTSTQIKVVYAQHERRIFLLKGEGLFDVAPDKERPFYVVAGATAVRAVGTIFNIELTNERMELTVTEGVVELNKPALVLAVASESGVTKEKETYLNNTRVEAGFIAVVENAVESVSPIDAGAIEKKLAWQNGVVVFEGETLEQVVAEISRYTTKTFFISDDGTRQIRIGGYFEVGDVEQMLDILQTGFNIQVSQDYSGVIRLSSAAKPHASPSRSL